jgi:NAD+ diphosphatase
MEHEWHRRNTRVLPIWRGKHLALPGDPPEVFYLSTTEPIPLQETTSPLFLGKSKTTPYFAADLSHLEDPLTTLELDGRAELLSLREMASLLSRQEGALLAYANGLTSWHDNHRFCGRCGYETQVTQAGHERKCRNKDCEHVHFPRTDPAVIMLVTDGDGRRNGEARCLLGRQSSWAPKIYSTLAGFVEPGESLEEAVAREVHEETGIEVREVRYHSSQPWPFPSSLMLGFTAVATNEEIRFQTDELEDARWFTSRELEERKGVKLPSKISIARRLIEDWLAGNV